jgi:hypothetical protein
MTLRPSFTLLLLAAACAVALWAPERNARAGGPLLVGGPLVGAEGQPMLWDLAAMPVRYRTDGGPLARRPDGTVVVDNAAGVTRVQAMFQAWQDVPTAAITYSHAGGILSYGTFVDGDVDTVEEFDAVFGSCIEGLQTPILFDADGMLFFNLTGEAGIIGFAGPCQLNPSTGHIVTGFSMMNGRFQDGLDSPWEWPANYEIPAAEFDEALAHEFGHLSGLDHSQINVEVLNQTPGQCSTTDLAGLPLMFPFSFCQARTSAGLPMLAPDDVAWVSMLYPETVNNPPAQSRFDTAYGLIRGVIYFSDGTTHAQGVNVIARDTTNLRRKAASVVSGYLFTGNPGQDVTSTNTGGDPFGSRQPLQMGAYEIPVPPGTYRVEVESIFPWFIGGSGVGPLSPPIESPGPREFWNLNESATDSTTDSSPVTVSAGSVVSEINIILNQTPPRFDSFESARLRWPEPPAARREEEKLLPRTIPA